MDVHRADLGLEAVEAGAADVGLYARIGSRIGHGDREEHVVRTLVVVIEDEAQTVLEKSQIETQVELRGGLPLHGGILHGRREQRRMTVVDIGGEGTVGVVESDAVVTGLAVGSAQLESVHPRLRNIPERLLGDDPCNRSRRKKAPLIALDELRRAVGAERSREDVTIVIIVLRPGEIGDEHLLLVLVRSRVVDARIEDGHVVGGRTGRIGRQIPVPLRHILVTAREIHRVDVAEGLVVVQKRGEGLADRLRACLGGGALFGDRVAEAVALAVSVVASAIRLIVVVVLPRCRQAVAYVPLEVEGGRGAVHRDFSVVEGLVPLGAMSVLVGDHQLVPIAVVVVFAGGRRDDQAASHRIVIISYERMFLLPRQIEGRRRFEPFGDLERSIAVDGEDIVAAHRHDAVVAEITGRCGVLQFVRSAVHTDILLMPEGVREPLRLPVGVGKSDDLRSVERVVHPRVTGRNRFPIPQITGREDRRGRRIARTVGIRPRQQGRRTVIVAVGIGVLDRRTQKVEILARIHEVPLARRRRHAELQIEYDLRPQRRRTLFGRHQNNAVRGTRSVDARRSGVFEHLHRLDVVGMDSVQILTQRTVDDIDRVVAHRDGRSAADHHAGRLARKRVARLYAQSRDLPFQCIGDGRHRRIVQFRPVDLRDRRGQRPPRLGAIPHHYDFVHRSRRFAERHIDGCTPADRLAVLRIAEIGEDQHIGRPRIDGVSSRRVGHRARGRTVDPHRNADERPSGRILDRTPYGFAFRRGGGRGSPLRRLCDEDAFSADGAVDVLPFENLLDDFLQLFVVGVDGDRCIQLDVVGLDRDRIPLLPQGEHGLPHGRILHFQAEFLCMYGQRNRLRQRCRHHRNPQPPAEERE